MKKTTFARSFLSPVGTIRVTSDESGVLNSIIFSEEMIIASSHPSIDNCITQLEEYFAGTRIEFNLKLPLDPEAAVPETSGSATSPFGSEFERSVWRQLLTVPFGTTCSYKDVADKLGNPGSIRAVGRANGKNPIAIVVPCHRVVGSDGSLTGYSGELWRKRWLLDHEAKLSGTILF